MKPARSAPSMIASEGEADRPRATKNWLRAVSLAVAGCTSLVLMLYPFALRGVPDSRLHTGLPLALLGVAGLFTYGLGYAPAHAATRVAFHPLTVWTLFAAGILIVLQDFWPSL